MTKGKLTEAASSFESDLALILEAATKWEASSEMISDKQHREMQRRAEKAEEEVKRIQKGEQR